MPVYIYKVGRARPNYALSQIMASRAKKDLRCQCSCLDLEVPLATSGETDWNSVGDKLVKELVKENKDISNVDKEYSRKQLLEHQTKSSWEHCYVKDDIHVFKKTTEQISFAGRGVIEVPLNDVASFIKDLETSFIWKKFIMDVRCERMIADSEECTDFIAYEIYESNQYCGLFTFKREMLYFLRCCFMNDMYIQSAVSVDIPERPRKADIPRVDVYPGTGFVLEPCQGDTSKTLATFFGNVDLKGLPSFMMSQVLKRYPLLLRYIRQYFTSPSIPSPIAANISLDASISSTWKQELTDTSFTENFEDTVPCKHYCSNHPK